MSPVPCCHRKHVTQKGRGCGWLMLTIRGGNHKPARPTLGYFSDATGRLQSTLTTGCRTLAPETQRWEVAHSHLQTQPGASCPHQGSTVRVPSVPSTSLAKGRQCLCPAPSPAPHAAVQTHSLPTETERVAPAVHTAPRTHSNRPHHSAARRVAGAGRAVGQQAGPGSVSSCSTESRWAGSAQVQRLGPGPPERMATHLPP